MQVIAASMTRCDVPSELEFDAVREEARVRDESVGNPIYIHAKSSVPSCGTWAS
jgi:hypothetical protein